MRALSIVLLTAAMAFLAGCAHAEKSPNAEAGRIDYLGEKTGSAESDLKRHLAPVLARYPDVERAYLAIVSRDGGATLNVALCLAPASGDRRVMLAAAEVFHTRFGQSQFLDLLFVSAEDEAALRRVCPPFYTRRAGAPAEPRPQSERVSR